MALLATGAEGISEIVKRSEDAGVRSIDITIPDIPGESRDPGTVTVVMDQFQFINKTITIKKGQTVLWINNEAPKHTATDDEATFNSGSRSQGDTFSFTFDETGEFPYFCRFHGDKGEIGMAGRIIVVDE